MIAINIVFLVAYFVGVAALDYWSSHKSLASRKSYFLGGGSIGWVAISASLFASNISAEHFIELAGSGASSGLAVGQFEWIAYIVLLLEWLFLPFELRPQCIYYAEVSEESK